MRHSGITALAAAVRQRLEGLGTVYIDITGTSLTLVPDLPGPVWAVTPNGEDCFVLHGGVGVAINMTGGDDDLIAEITEQILAATNGHLVETLELIMEGPLSVGWDLSFPTGRAHAGTLTGPGVVTLRYPAWASPA